MKFSASLFDTCMFPIEVLSFAAIRRELAGRVSGRLLEIGPGTGANMSALAAFANGRLTGYTGIDPGPTPALVKRLRDMTAETGVPVRIVEGSAEDMPFADNSFDTVLVTLVLCSVRSQGEALREIRRVLAPGGRLLYMEHVIHPGPGVAAVMNTIDPLYNRITRECHLNRDTRQALLSAGFCLTDFHRHRSGLLIWGESCVRGEYCPDTGSPSTTV
ncbi:MAG: class I SAM-dependent methyltransferase [Spirochaeta sp.]